MAGRSSNDDILQQLRLGIIDFEISSSPVPSVSTHFPRSSSPSVAFTDATPRFFARIGNLAGSGSPALKKVERYSVRRVTGDGRCLFRALVKGMALNKDVPLSSQEERENADDLRMAVREIICDNGNERQQYEEALIAITVEEPLRRYCQRIRRPDFWGGEAELLVLSKLCCQHIVVYIPEHEHGGGGSGFIPIQEYGTEFHRSFKNKKTVRLLYTGKNHYDLLV
ncbi:OVARIAN TUMOR DOMAIN-containing deubiquitinating enzyme 3 isoform X1 [Primulina huaijiensis]|uniref:OVARIAN TUMOR DOMAIN-containing deubiquitinating enzyme 3 isoform X1 n=1 Tax=Primulina huaijiensis TaxID=1492673 RepID=UPI003CC6E516